MDAQYKVIAQGHVPNHQEHSIANLWISQIHDLIKKSPQSHRIVIFDYVLKTPYINETCSYEKIMNEVERFFSPFYRVSFMIPFATVIRTRLVLKEN